MPGGGDRSSADVLKYIRIAALSRKLTSSHGHKNGPIQAERELQCYYTEE